jgi:hypothetical protein
MPNIDILGASVTTSPALGEFNMRRGSTLSISTSISSADGNFDTATSFRQIWLLIIPTQELARFNSMNTSDITLYGYRFQTAFIAGFVHVFITPNSNATVNITIERLVVRDM